VLFVPIGLGSGFAGAAAARAHCGVSTRLIGVVSAHATAYRDSFLARKPVASPVSTRLADGMACRTPVPESVEVILREADDVVMVTDDEIAQAMRILFSDTHNVAEGAGAAALAAALQQQARWRGKTVGISVSGGNVDSDMFAGVLAGASAR
jgi:threonine dehydratase